MKLSTATTKKCQQNLGDERKSSLYIPDIPEKTNQSLAYLLLLAVTTASLRQLCREKAEKSDLSHLIK